VIGMVRVFKKRNIILIRKVQKKEKKKAAKE